MGNVLNGIGFLVLAPVFFFVDKVNIEILLSTSLLAYVIFLVSIYVDFKQGNLTKKHKDSKWIYF